MKNLSITRFLPAMAFLALLLTAPQGSNAQFINEAAKKKVNIGVGLLTDIWLNAPDDMKVRTINQGAHVTVMYNMPMGKSNLSFAIGGQITVHNLYWNYQFTGRSDSLQFMKAHDTIGYKRSKLSLPYLELPVEFRLKTKYKMTFGVGFKLGYMVHAHSKWVGDDYIFKSRNQIKSSFKGLKNLEKVAFGPTLRVGYKWFHLYGHYQLSDIFEKGKGPGMQPITVGFMLMPF